MHARQSDPWAVWTVYMGLDGSVMVPATHIAAPCNTNATLGATGDLK